VPQAALLPHCAAVVHHAGAGTLLGALSHGLPQVAIPQGADNFIHAQLLEKANVAKRLEPGHATAHAVRAAMRELLADPSYRTAASAVAAQIQAMPSPAQVAADLRAD
jgi:UDP:flavonoid glycosyltransferase YjiC (YdhE family)